MKKLILTLVAATMLTGCKGITKTFLSSEGGDSGVVSVESNSVYGKHTLRSMNPLPGHSVLMHPDGTMEMRWIGTNVVPMFDPEPSARGTRTPGWTVPLIVDPRATPAPNIP